MRTDRRLKIDETKPTSSNGLSQASQPARVCNPAAPERKTREVTDWWPKLNPRERQRTAEISRKRMNPQSPMDLDSSQELDPGNGFTTSYLRAGSSNDPTILKGNLLGKELVLDGITLDEK